MIRRIFIHSSQVKRFLLTLLCLLLAPYVLTMAKAAQEPIVTLEMGSVLERELKGGQTHTFQIHLVSGQFLHVVVDQRGIDVLTTLQAKDGQLITKVDSPYSTYGPEPIVMVAERTGDYFLEVGSANKKAAAGRYEIRVLALREATQADREQTSAERAFAEAYMKLAPQRTATSLRAAIEKYQEALRFYQSSGDRIRQALALRSIGANHMNLSEFRQALEYLNQALALFQSLGDERMKASTINYIGGAHDVLGDFQEALEDYRQALRLAHSLGDRSLEASILNNVGKIHQDTADWQQSLDYYNKALSLFRDLGDQRREAVTLHNIGLAYFGLGEFENAQEHFESALQLRRATGDKSGEAETLNSIGQVHAAFSRQQQALELYKQSLQLRRAIGDRRGEGVTLNYMGVAHLVLGEHERALEHFQSALELLQSAEDRRNEAIALGNIGQAYAFLNQTQKAVEYYDRARSLFQSISDPQNEARMLQGLARAERDGGDLAEALQHIKAAICIFEKVRGRFGNEQWRASYLATRQDAYQFQIDLLMRMHRRESAAGYDIQALQTSERARARSLLEMLTESHADIRQGADAALLDREHELMQALNAKALRRTGRNTPQQLDALNKEISLLESEYRDVQTAIRQNNPHYASITQPEPIGLKEIQGRLLDPDSLLLEYALGEERSYLWVVSADAITSYELPRRELIQKAAARVTELLTARSVRQRAETPPQRAQRIADADAQLPDAAQQLSKMVLAPAADKLAGHRLLVVPDGPLQYVPFAMLPDPAIVNAIGEAQPTNPQSRTPLVVGHELVTLPSASTLAVMRKELAGRPPAPKMLAVFADPVFAGDDERSRATARPGGKTEPIAKVLDAFADGRSVVHEEKASSTVGGIGSGKLLIPRLPFTRQEADRILAITPNTANLKAVDFRASRAMATGAELSQYRYLHFATHGLLDTDRPGLSALVLSLVDEQGKPQDGFLRVHEIYNLNLPAELVVLSACQTGLGKEYKGEGLVGLTRGFMYAGAARVMVSLWNVNDRATAELMPRFYQKMLKEGQRPAAALRSAQVEMWKQKQWQAPYYWAAFVMQGEWK